jgi:hypothetical protein
VLSLVAAPGVTGIRVVCRESLPGGKCLPGRRSERIGHLRCRCIKRRGDTVSRAVLDGGRWPVPSPYDARRMRHMTSRLTAGRVPTRQATVPPRVKLEGCTAAHSHIEPEPQSAVGDPPARSPPDQTVFDWESTTAKDSEQGKPAPTRFLDAHRLTAPDKGLCLFEICESACLPTR